MFNRWTCAGLLISTLPVFMDAFFVGEQHTGRIVDARSDGLRFVGAASDVDFFKLLYLDDNFLLVGARDAVYNISMRDFSEQTSIVWPSTQKEIGDCIMKGKSKVDCRNYIRVLHVSPGRELLVCGTNAFHPACRRYARQWDGAYALGDADEFSGVGLAPYDPQHNSTYVMVDGRLIAGTVKDFNGNDAIIYAMDPARVNQLGVQTPSDEHFLNDPSFVGSYTLGPYAYFFLRETLPRSSLGSAKGLCSVGANPSSDGTGGDDGSAAVGHEPVMHARVARVCAKDAGGGSLPFSQMWTSFLKARLNCSAPGEYPFYFDRLEAVSNVVLGNYDNSGARRQLVYGVFGTPYAAVQGSAVCAFDVSAIDNVFATGDFASSSDPAVAVPTPRPGDCSASGANRTDEQLAFIKTHPLIASAVPNFFGAPVLVYTDNGERMTRVAVDPQVTDVYGKRYDILFVGTDRGRILKFVNIKPHAGGEEIAVRIETLRIMTDASPIRNLMLHRPSAHTADSVASSQESVLHSSSVHRAHVLAVADDQVRKVAVHRCTQQVDCAECVGLRDPYCAWNVRLRKCVSAIDGRWSATDKYVQSVLAGDKSDCPPPPNVIRKPVNSDDPYQSHSNSILMARDAALDADQVLQQTDNDVQSVKGDENMVDQIAPSKVPPSESAPPANGILYNIGFDYGAPPSKAASSGELQSTRQVKSTGDHSKPVSLASNPYQHIASATVGSVVLAVVASVAVSSVIGFAAGYLCRARRCFRGRKQLSQKSSFRMDDYPTSAASIVTATTPLPTSISSGLYAAAQQNGNAPVRRSHSSAATPQPVNGNRSRQVIDAYDESASGRNQLQPIDVSLVLDLDRDCGADGLRDAPPRYPNDSVNRFNTVNRTESVPLGANGDAGGNFSCTTLPRDYKVKVKQCYL